MITKQCDECGKNFEVDDSKRNWQHVILCSDRCRKDRMARDRREKYERQTWPQKKQCQWCGQNFLVHGPGGPPRKYCSRKCYLDQKRHEREKEVEAKLEKKNCLICGKEFIPSKYVPHQKYCSRNCFTKEMYRKHGDKRKRPVETQVEINRVRRGVLKRDNKTCQLCGGTEKPQVHHIDNTGGSEISNNGWDNLITLCKECHTAIHRVTVVQVNGEWRVKGKIFEVLNLTGSIKIEPQTKNYGA